ncbi:MAG: YqeG family IIIA-type phosphatase [Clostridiales bacterium]|jgi:HAD superfamily phosphatase (TIGR01668 family)|nr:YqeG family IIIA-type phosphatase [Clostridiales bacterium]
MKTLLKPNYYVSSIYSIDFIKIKNRGIENLIIDIDNTLVPWGSGKADERAFNLIKELRMLEFKICLLSNSSKKRVLKFMDIMDVGFFSLGIKPMKIMFMGALKRLCGKPTNTCVIGDQIFTDIVGGNRCCIHTILVDPISSQEFPTTKYIRFLEKKTRQSLAYSSEIMKNE